MTGTVNALDFLGDSTVGEAKIIVLFGSERFLRRLVISRLMGVETNENPGDPFSAVRLTGDDADWRDVYDEIATASLFSQDSNKLVVVDDADGFVKKNRDSLDDYFQAPDGCGCLVLVVGSWASNTRLYKAAAKNHLQIECEAPTIKRGRSKSVDSARMKKWLVDRAASQHKIKLTASLAGDLLELVENDLGRADLEMEKLALFFSPTDKITAQKLIEIVGGWRSKSVWDAVDAAVDGKSAEALGHLDRLLGGGEHPLGLYGQLAWSLRRYANVWEILSRSKRQQTKLTMRQALQEAGFRNWNNELENAERRIKHLGRDRVKQLYAWMLQLDLALKGSHSREDRARFSLEMLVFRMAKPAASVTR